MTVAFDDVRPAPEPGETMLDRRRLDYLLAENPLLSEPEARRELGLPPADPVPPPRAEPRTPRYPAGRSGSRIGEPAGMSA